MKRFVSTLAVVGCTVLSACNPAVPPVGTIGCLAIDDYTPPSIIQDSDIRRYTQEAGRIVYRLSGVQEGQKTKYFDAWGLLETDEDTAVMMADEEEIRLNQVTMFWFDHLYVYDLDQKTGTKIYNPILTHLAEQTGSNDMASLSTQLLLDMGAEVSDGGVIADYATTLYTLADAYTKTWVSEHGIPLKTEIAFPDDPDTSLVIEATTVEFGAVPAEKFVLPRDVCFVEDVEE